ncbi:ABC transporter permease subunit [Natronomonas sp.]|uniref:ABC transporter permease subunit n=1 Tax=Natronomonas sp. TaxID=2184060 RepID=UPI0026235086|nr:branched-chain amino acid ABC transporter permease [Natronomonas sp.]
MALTNVLDITGLMLSSFGTLVLAAVGLAIIFGMMRIINLAHGEFIMIGAYATAFSFSAGVPLALAIPIGGLVTGIVGLVLERLIIRHLYDRLVDSMVATWGISLIFAQGMLIIAGPSFSDVPTPLGPISYGDFSMSLYRVVLAASAIGLLIALYGIYTYTTYGRHARATMQDEETARSLGVNTDRIYMITFFIGSVMAGIAGGLLSPIVSIVPTLGQSYIIEAFVTVIVAGPSVILGTILSGFSLSVVNAPVSQWAGSFAGRVALLVAAIVIIRLLPEGISGYWMEGGE